MRLGTKKIDRETSGSEVASNFVPRKPRISQNFLEKGDRHVQLRNPHTVS